jgi:P-type E1-E2 ATPase
VERKTNIYIFAVFILLLAVSIGCAIGSYFYLLDLRSAVYLDLVNTNAAGQAAVNFVTFFILFGQMIPISLYTSMEIVRLLQAFFMQQDLNMYYEKNDVPMVARSTTLNEELGQVSMIFSDKTGTLTQNQMQFRKCVVGGKTYGRGYTEIGLANARRRGEHIEEHLISDESKLKVLAVIFFLV